MPFTTPTLPELIDRAANEIETRLPGVDARLRRSNLAVFSRIHSGAVHGLYGLLRWLSKQILPDTADNDILNRHSNIWNITRKAAAQATGTVQFTGSNGLFIPAGTTLQRADFAEFKTVSDQTFSGATMDVIIQAVEGGVDGNTAASSKLTLISPIAGVNSTAIVDGAGIAGGSDTEGDDALRARLLARIQQPPHGGASFDYVQWALEIAGVTRAWVYPLESGAGTVTVRFVTDDDPGGLIPNGAKVAEVDAHIDYLRPVTANVTVLAPVAAPVDIEISNLNPNTAEVKAAVEAELAGMFRREAEPGGTILISHIREAVSIASGEDDHAIVVPAGNVTHTANQMPTLGVVTYS